MRSLTIPVILLSVAFLLSGCESHPVPTAGSASTTVVHPPKDTLQKKHLL